ncbi:MAG: hypothetical protein ACTHJ0_14670 [Flavipsychrobacter sp.]
MSDCLPRRKGQFCQFSNPVNSDSDSHSVAAKEEQPAQPKKKNTGISYPNTHRSFIRE